MIQTITNIDSLVKVTNTIISLQKDVEMIDTRVDDFYSAVTIFSVLIIAIALINVFSSTRVARKQAIEEFKDMKDTVQKAENRIEDLHANIKQLEEKIKTQNELLRNENQGEN